MGLCSYYTKHIRSVLSLRDGLCAQMLAGLGHIGTSSEWRSGILQNVPDTKPVSIETTLVALFLAEGAQRFVVLQGIMNVLSFIHFTPEQPPAHWRRPATGK